MRAILMAATAVAVLAGGAAAQEHPPLAPAKDVTVEYQYKATPVGAPAQEGQSRIATAAEGKRMRIDGFVPQGYMVMDRTSGRMMMVMNTQHMYMEMPIDPARAGPMMLRDTMKFARKGTDTVAGVRCTVWDIQGDQGTGSACISDDGVVLRAESNGKNGQVQMTATSVKFGALGDDVFQAPAGYQKMQMPTMAPGTGGRPPQQKP